MKNLNIDKRYIFRFSVFLALIFFVSLIYYFSNNSNVESSTPVINEKVIQPFEEGSIAFIPFEKDKDTISLEEQIQTVGISSGAEILIITTYEQANKDLSDDFQDMINQIIKTENVLKVEVGGKNRYVIQGDVVNQLFNSSGWNIFK